MEERRQTATGMPMVGMLTTMLLMMRTGGWLLERG
jgi:hypothetical protein